MNKLGLFSLLLVGAGALVGLAQGKVAEKQQEETIDKKVNEAVDAKWRTIEDKENNG